MFVKQNAGYTSNLASVYTSISRFYCRQLSTEN